MKAAGFDLVIVETSGHRPERRRDRRRIGRVPVCDDPEYGAATQLEKIDMLDYADVIAINKFDRGVPRTPCATSASSAAQPRPPRPNADEELPIYGTIASQFNDPGVTALYYADAN